MKIKASRLLTKKNSCNVKFPQNKKAIETRLRFVKLDREREIYQTMTDTLPRRQKSPFRFQRRSASKTARMKEFCCEISGPQVKCAPPSTPCLEKPMAGVAL